MYYEVHILSVVPATVPAWAVFTSDEGPSELWLERVHLWAHVRRSVSEDDKESDAFLGKESPKDRFTVEGMVLQDGLTLVSELEYVFVGYSDDNPLTAAQEEVFKKGIKSARWFHQKSLSGEDQNG